MNEERFYVRTYDNGTHTIEAPDIMTAINVYLGRTGRSVFTIHTVVKASESAE
jgi:hypothetical protein